MNACDECEPSVLFTLLITAAINTIIVSLDIMLHSPHGLRIFFSDILRLLLQMSFFSSSFLLSLSSCFPPPPLYLLFFLHHSVQLLHLALFFSLTPRMSSLVANFVFSLIFHPCYFFSLSDCFSCWHMFVDSNDDDAQQRRLCLLHHRCPASLSLAARHTLKKSYQE